MKLALLCTLLAAPALHAGEAADRLREGDALDRQLKTTEALQAYQAADRLEPKQAGTLCKIAREYGLSMDDTTDSAEKKRRGQQALECAQQAVALAPDLGDAQLSVAICYGRLATLLDNKTKLAYSKKVKEHADLALKLSPGNDLCHHVLGVWNYELAGLGGFSRALAGALYGKVPEASYPEAEKYFRKAVALNPERLANHVELGRTLLAEGNKKAAQAELAKALAMPNREKDDPHERDLATAALKQL